MVGKDEVEFRLLIKSEERKQASCKECGAELHLGERSGQKQKDVSVATKHSSKPRTEQLLPTLVSSKYAGSSAVCLDH